MGFPQMFPQFSRVFLKTFLGFSSHELFSPRGMFIANVMMSRDLQKIFIGIHLWTKGHFSDCLWIDVVQRKSISKVIGWLSLREFSVDSMALKSTWIWLIECCHGDVSAETETLIHHSVIHSNYRRTDLYLSPTLLDDSWNCCLRPWSPSLATRNCMEIEFEGRWLRKVD